jgi:hypothetical protein
MDVSVQVAVISAATSVIVAAGSFVWTNRQRRQDDLRQRKLDHYKELLSAFSELAIDGTDKDAANLRLCRAMNTIALVAPQEVVTALMNYHKEVAFSNSDRTRTGHDRLLNVLLLAIRRSLDLPSDNPNTFAFHFIGSKPPDRL